eukprot:gene6572-9033_t
MVFVFGSDSFTLGVRDSIMIAHSFTGTEFGPAQNMHGATYTVDVDFICSDLVKKSNWVIDIGFASDILSDVLKEYNFKNLNDIYPDDNTTTEFMCREIYKKLEPKLQERQFRGKVRVKLFESHKAWASYSNDII